MRFVFYAILIYLAYQLIFNLIIPVVKTSRRLKKGFREMHEKMNQQYGQHQPNNAQASSSSPEDKPKISKEDYIDFEEIK
jgi:sortase (surface protein transpeptidase)